MALSKSDFNKIDKLFSKAEGEDFKYIAALYKGSLDFYNSCKRSQFSIGQKVSFTSNRTGELVTGILIKKNPKYQHVKTESGTWKVPTSMLSAA